MIGSQSFIDEVVSKQVRGEGQGKGEIAGMRELARLRSEEGIKKIEWQFWIQSEEIGNRAQRYTKVRYLASYLLRQHCWMSLRGDWGKGRVALQCSRQCDSPGEGESHTQGGEVSEGVGTKT